MSSDTICGVFINAFKQPPTPRELGRIVGHMSVEDQATFLMDFAEAINDTTAYIHRSQRMAMLAEALVTQERAVISGMASNFLAELAALVESENSK